MTEEHFHWVIETAKLWQSIDISIYRAGLSKGVTATFESLYDLRGFVHDVKLHEKENPNDDFWPSFDHKQETLTVTVY